MSKKERPKEKEKGGGVVTATNFVLAKVDGKFVRFSSVSAIPEGVAPITLETVNEMTVEEIGALYGEVAHVSPKKFKDKKVAVESLIYQIAKMPIFDPTAAKVSPPAAKGAAAVRATAVEKKYVRKTPDNFELLQPQEVEKVLLELAPQARELILIMTDLAKEKRSTTFSSEDLNAKLKTPASVAQLRTKQDPLRILQYYKGKLISAGLIRVS